MGNAWLWLHVGLVSLGACVILLSAFLAFLYLLQSAQLKSKHLGNYFWKLPPLGKIEKLHFRFLSVGLVLFSLGLLSGLGWAHDYDNLSRVIEDPKVILSILTCLIYWMIWSLRARAMRRGQKIAVGTLLALILLAVTVMTTHSMSNVWSRGF